MAHASASEIPLVEAHPIQPEVTASVVGVDVGSEEVVALQDEPVVAEDAPASAIDLSDKQSDEQVDAKPSAEDVESQEEVADESPEEVPELSDDVDVRTYEEDPDPTEEYDEDGGFVVKDADVEAVIAEEVVLHTDAEITVRNVLPEGEKRKRRPPERYEPVETPLDDVDRPAKRRKTDRSQEGSAEEDDGEGDEDDEEEDDEEEDDEDGDEEEGDEEEGDETDEEYVAGSTESEESESSDSEEEEEEPINIVD